MVMVSMIYLKKPIPITMAFQISAMLIVITMAFLMWSSSCLYHCPGWIVTMMASMMLLMLIKPAVQISMVMGSMID